MRRHESAWHVSSPSTNWCSRATSVGGAVAAMLCSSVRVAVEVVELALAGRVLEVGVLLGADAVELGRGIVLGPRCARA